VPFGLKPNAQRFADGGFTTSTLSRPGSKLFAEESIPANSNRTLAECMPATYARWRRSALGLRADITISVRALGTTVDIRSFRFVAVNRCPLPQRAAGTPFKCNRVLVRRIY
jgi:hypothetical protein